MQAEAARARSEQDERLSALERAAAAAPISAAPIGAAGPPAGGPAVINSPPARPGILQPDQRPARWTLRSLPMTRAISCGARANMIRRSRRCGHSARPTPDIAGRAGRITSLAGPCSTRASRGRRRSIAGQLPSNPKGERAADSLFYLGQALMRLEQAEQACKAYAELEAVYGAAMREECAACCPLPSPTPAAADGQSSLRGA
jgi:hypothetical protein